MEGDIFGEVEIVLRRNRIDTYIAKTDCYILKLGRDIFEEIMEDIHEFRDEI